jgi:GrpB-like predicted nucleotidyltransferase (UPF0157 family)
MEIETYHPQPPEFLPWDSRFPVVAERVAGLILDAIDGIQIEHVGSTSVPECGGKGVIDLLVLYAPGQLARVRDAVDALGFQKQVEGHLFPEERPMRVGAVRFQEKVYRCHVHLLTDQCEEALRLIRFREELRADARQREEYVRLKKQIIQKQIEDPEEYTDQKGLFFTSASEFPKKS